MEKAQTIEEFYQEKFNWMPDNLRKEFGHFNVFRMSDFVGPNPKVLPQAYNRKDFYKISVFRGHVKVFYADKSVEVEKKSFIFTNPLVPFTLEKLGEHSHDGYFCIFTEAFISQLGHIKDYPIFKPGEVPVFSLNDEQEEEINKVYLKMLDEINSDFTYKYDVLRNLILELVYIALKMQPAIGNQYTDSTGSLRVASLFTELLERQFPVESAEQKVRLRSPNDFANHLSVHVNHLNRSLKEITGKTTSKLIADRIVQEARVLLKFTDWNISEIAWCLGFEEPPHFINFFKKNTLLTPNSFRKLPNV
jgi:AraC-like DNA-binding protein